MKKAQLNKEYSKVMLKAAKAAGRKETMNLYKKARLIRKELHLDEPDYPVMNIS